MESTVLAVMLCPLVHQAQAQQEVEGARSMSCVHMSWCFPGSRPWLARPPRPPTQPAPFHLVSVERHEEEVARRQQELEAKAAQEEERRRFHARPVPNFAGAVSGRPAWQ